MLHIITGMYPINMPLNMFQIYMSGLKQNMHKLCRQNFRVGQIVLISMSRDRMAYRKRQSRCFLIQQPKIHVHVRMASTLLNFI